jgi:hypothetical protein
VHGLRQLLPHDGCSSKLKIVLEFKDKIRERTIRMEIQKSKISLQRWMLFIVAGVAFLLFVFHVTGNICVFLLGGLAFFFGVTDFGRQCPLLPVVHHIRARIRTKS